MAKPLSPRFLNIAVCNLLTASIVRVQTDLAFTFRFTNENSRCFQELHRYILTTIALLALATSATGLLIVAGEALSTAIILAGLPLIFVTRTLVSTRRIHELSLSTRKEALRNPKSFMV